MNATKSDFFSNRFIFAAIILSALLTGCEAENPPPPTPKGPKLIPVTGKVMLDHKPLPGAVLIFLPSSSDSGTHGVGETKADGSFEMAHLYQPGLAAGDYRVAVSYQVGGNGKLVTAEIHSAIAKPPEFLSAKELVPDRYSNLSKTELRATVKRGMAPLEFNLEGPLLGPLVSPYVAEPKASP